MNKEIARNVLFKLADCSVSLSSLVPYLKVNCSDKEEYEEISKKIAEVMAFLHLDLSALLYEQHPDLKEEVDRMLRRE